VREGERNERGRGWISERHRHFRGRGRAEIFVVLKIPRKCPHVLLVKESGREGKALGSEESKAMDVGWFRLRTKEIIRECSLLRLIGILILTL
jgi:hypothetical protein